MVFRYGKLHDSIHRTCLICSDLTIYVVCFNPSYLMARKFHKFHSHDKWFLIQQSKWKFWNLRWNFSWGFTTESADSEYCLSLINFSWFTKHFFVFVFLAFDFLSVLRGHSVFSSPPQRTNDIQLRSLWYDAVLDCGLKPGPPALQASTLPLGYRGGGIIGLLWFDILSRNGEICNLFFVLSRYVMKHIFIIFLARVTVARVTVARVTVVDLLLY